MKYPGEIYEESERKILKECVHTRNKHIELEERYEKLVSRRASKIDLSALEKALRKKDVIEEEAKQAEETESYETFRVENTEADTEKAACEHKQEETDILITESEPEVSEEPKSGEEPVSEKEATFEEILELQKKIKSRMEAQRNEDFYKLFFDDEKATENEQYLMYNEPVLTKYVSEGPEVEVEDQEIVSVEVDEIILPEKDGIGIVFAVPIENKDAENEKKEVSIKKSAMGIVMAVAVLIIGALLIYSMWPAGI